MRTHPSGRSFSRTDRISIPNLVDELTYGEQGNDVLLVKYLNIAD